MLARLDDYDWKMAFECCGSEQDGDDYGSPYNEPDVGMTDGYKKEVKALRLLGQDPPADAEFTREDVVSIIAIEDGENDEASWIAVFELHDGRFAYLEAGCDYTGWD